MKVALSVAAFQYAIKHKFVMLTSIALRKLHVVPGRGSSDG
jgi:hypothetical protein